MTALCVVPGVVAALALIFVFAVFPGKKSKGKAFYGRNIAHRGLYDNESPAPENSLAAFRRAVESGYGVELDVQLSRDGEVVVFHDDGLKRVCGVDSPVASLDLAELKKLSLCGSGETIPLFTEALDVIGKEAPLIVELKTGKRNRELCEKTLAILRGFGGVFCIESFDPTIVRWFRKNAKDICRGQLSQPVTEFRRFGFSLPVSFLLGNCLLGFLTRADFIAYRIGKTPFPVKLAFKLGAMKVGWTASSPEPEKDYDVVIFERYTPEREFRKWTGK